jgi:hypothetical protein
MVLKRTPSEVVGHPAPKGKTKMYTANTIARRRPQGWSDRRRYFRRLLEMARTKVEKPVDKLPEAELVPEKD